MTWLGACNDRLHSDEFSEHSDEKVRSNRFLFICFCEQVCLPLWISWAEWSESANSQEDTEAIFKVQAPSSDPRGTGNGWFISKSLLSGLGWVLITRFDITKFLYTACFCFFSFNCRKLF